MKKIILTAAAALALAACGELPVDDRALGNAAAAVDEGALVDAVDRSIDRTAVEGAARDAVAGAIREAIPAEVRAVGAVVDEKALAKGVDRAIDGKALGAAVEAAVAGEREPAEK